MTASATRPTSYRDIVHQVISEGCSLSYRHNVIDVEVAASLACVMCGHEGLQYEAWRNNEPRRYYAVAVCPECGEAEVF